MDDEPCVSGNLFLKGYSWDLCVLGSLPGFLEFLKIFSKSSSSWKSFLGFLEFLEFQKHRVDPSHYQTTYGLLDPTTPTIPRSKTG
jgi:hypothetical protein